jgi:hypothetical protein
MLKRDVIGLTIIFILGICILFYNSNYQIAYPIGPTIGVKIPYDAQNNYKDEYNIPESDAMGIINGNVTPISDGNWNLTFGVFTQERMNYWAVLAVWYDSSGNVISKNLIWNQSISNYSETYPASNVAHMKNGATPTEIKIIYDYAPVKTNKETQVVYLGKINGTYIKWDIQSPYSNK